MKFLRMVSSSILLLLSSAYSVSAQVLDGYVITLVAKGTHYMPETNFILSKQNFQKSHKIILGDSTFYMARLVKDAYVSGTLACCEYNAILVPKELLKSTAHNVASKYDSIYERMRDMHYYDNIVEIKDNSKIDFKANGSSYKLLAYYFKGSLCGCTEFAGYAMKSVTDTEGKPISRGVFVINNLDKYELIPAFNQSYIFKHLARGLRIFYDK